MKKKILIIIAVILLTVMTLFLLVLKLDNLKFKLSYEYINYIEYSNGKKIKVNIPLNNNIKYLNEEELLNILKSGTGIVYFGYNSCPWCRNAIPILIEAVNNHNIDTIYYADIHKLNISKIRTELYSLIDDYLEVDNDDKKVLAVPDVYFLKNGKIIGEHRGTVEGYNNPYNGMNNSQKEELRTIYENFIEEMEK